MSSHLGVVVEVRDLVVLRGGRAAVSDLSFTARSGQVTGLMGPSGCGQEHADALARRCAGGRGRTRHESRAPRGQLPTGLDVLSALLPLSYAVDAMRDTAGAGPELLVITGCTVALLALGAVTLLRRTE